MKWFLGISSFFVIISFGVYLYSYSDYNSKVIEKDKLTKEIGITESEINYLTNENNDKDTEINNIKTEKSNVLEEYELWQSYKSMIESSL